MAPGREITADQRLDELRDELAEVRMEPVDVLRALALGQVALGPRKLEVDLGIEGVLCRGHGPTRFDAAPRTPAPVAPTSCPARRRRRTGSSSLGAPDSLRATRTRRAARAEPSRS